MVNAEKETLKDVIELKNKVNDVRSNKAKVQKAINLLTTTTFLDIGVNEEGTIYISEVDSSLGNITEALNSIVKFYNAYEVAVVNELEEPVPMVKHKLKVYLQNSNKTVRYYYNSNYLFSAPLELFEELEIEFNRLMNIEPKLSLTEVIEQMERNKNFLVILKEAPVELEELEAVEEEVYT